MRAKLIAEVLLWIAIGVNGFLASRIVSLIWDRVHGIHENQAEFEIVMRIAVVSVPISILCLSGLAVWAVLRFTVPRVAGYTVERGLLILTAINVVAPVLLWYGTIRAMR